jgi:integrase/recombinase XerC
MDRNPLVATSAALRNIRTTMSADETEATIPPAIFAEWWQPFEDFLAKERRYSAYTVRNYRQAFGDFYR